MLRSISHELSQSFFKTTPPYSMVNSVTVQKIPGMGFSLLLHWLGFRQRDVNGCDVSRGLTACLAWLGSCPSACPEQRLLGMVFGPKTMRADPNQTTTSTTAPQPVRTLRSEKRKYVLSQGMFCPTTFHNTYMFCYTLWWQ